MRHIENLYVVSIVYPGIFRHTQGHSAMFRHIEEYLGIIEAYGAMIRHIPLCTAPLSAGGGGGGLTPPQIFKKNGGGLTGPQSLEGVAGKEGVNFFRGLQFLDKRQTKIWNICLYN